MAYYLITAFDGTTLESSSRRMVEMFESHTVVTRIGQLENGGIFDADGTADADTALGLVTARYVVTSTDRGMTVFNSNLREFEALKGKNGTLTGVEKDSPDDSYTCTARLINVIPQPYVVGNDPPMAANFRQRAYIVMVWQKLTEWAT